MKARVLASVTHLLASLAVISVFLLVVYFIWYPGPLSELHGVIDAIKVVIGVDIVLGPLITLIIFNTRKQRKELVRDISVIVLVQISALAWGAYTTFMVRPVFVVFYYDAFHSVVRNDIASDTKGGDMAIPGFWQRPKQVYIPRLKGKKAVQHANDLLSKGVPPIKFQVSRYLPIEEHKQAVLEEAMDMTRYLEKEENRVRLDAFLQSHGGTKDNYSLYPLEYGPFRSIVGVNRENLALTGLLTKVGGR